MLLNNFEDSMKFLFMWTDYVYQNKHMRTLNWEMWKILIGLLKNNDELHYMLTKITFLWLFYKLKTLYFPESKNQWEDRQCFTFLQISLMADFISIQLDFLLRSVFNMCVVVSETHISHSCWKIPLYNCDRKRMKNVNNLLVLLWK